MRVIVVSDVLVRIEARQEGYKGRERGLVVVGRQISRHPGISHVRRVGCKRDDQRDGCRGPFDRRAPGEIMLECQLTYARFGIRIIAIVRAVAYGKSRRQLTVDRGVDDQLCVLGIEIAVADGRMTLKLVGGLIALDGKGTAG